MTNWFKSARRSVLGLVALLLAAVGLPAAFDAPASAATGALVLYDTTGPYGYLGELYGTMTVNLASRFGTVKAKPVTQYVKGEMSAYAGVIYIGSTYDEPLPNSFLDDVITGTTPVLWAYDNIWRLTARQPALNGTFFANTNGWIWTGFDTRPISKVNYKSYDLTRYTGNGSGVMGSIIYDGTKAKVLATAVADDGTRIPWAIRSKNLTYIGELPLSYIAERDRYLAFADLLYDQFAPTTVARHRAVLRLEDISPDSDPNELRQIADWLSSQGVPFAFQQIGEYTDPKGAYSGGVPVTERWLTQATVSSAMRYMATKGGTPIMHGFTHQYSNVNNPYSGTTGDDFEFFGSYVDAQNFVRLSGPLPGDSQAWATGRINSGFTEYLLGGLSRPTIWTTPHYAASANDYKAVKASFAGALERRIYSTGLLSGGVQDYSRIVGQFFPYPVTDVFGQVVVPENLGNEEPDAFNNNPPRLPADIIENARANLVVRDGFASFFWHPFLVSDTRVTLAHLQQIVNGIKALGYTFVSPTSVVPAPRSIVRGAKASSVPAVAWPETVGPRSQGTGRPMAVASSGAALAAGVQANASAVSMGEHYARPNVRSAKAK